MIAIDRTRVVFAGSGAFGVPTLEAIRGSKDMEVVLVVTPPDRPAGRGQQPTPTPIAELAARSGLARLATEDVNSPASLEAIRAAAPHALVVIAFGQKLGPEVRDAAFSINLHASLLPKYRGAAPIQRALMGGERTTGLSVISLAERMDAGEVHERVEVAIDPRETAGELHDRLAALGPQAVLRVLRRLRAGEVRAEAQDERLATRAPKISREDAWVDFARDAEHLRGWIHGLSPRPGCTIRIDGRALRLVRVEAVGEVEVAALAEVDASKVAPGTLVEPGLLRCARGWLHPLEVQPAGGRVMSWEEWRRGHAVASGTKVESP